MVEAGEKEPHLFCKIITLLNMQTYFLRCRFCNVTTGQIQFREIPADIASQFVDIRCPSCEHSFGNYKKMEEQFKDRKIQNTKFEEVIERAHFKQADFTKELDKLI